MHNDLHPPLDPDMLAALAASVRARLSALASGEAPLTYQTLARELGLMPPHSIYRVVQALERTMREDAAAGRPFIAARVISRTRGGLPAPGFFELATQLGTYDGSESGPAARAFHQAQLQAIGALSAG